MSIIDFINKQESLDLYWKVNDYFTPVIVQKKIRKFSRNYSSILDSKSCLEDNPSLIIFWSLLEYSEDP